MHLLAHLQGSFSRFRVSALDHLTHVDLSLSQVHHLKVIANSELIVVEVVFVGGSTRLGLDWLETRPPSEMLYGALLSLYHLLATSMLQLGPLALDWQLVVVVLEALVGCCKILGP